MKGTKRSTKKIMKGKTTIIKEQYLQIKDMFAPDRDFWKALAYLSDAYTVIIYSGLYPKDAHEFFDIEKSAKNLFILRTPDITKALGFIKFKSIL